jgi:hypothetical protein
LIAGDQVPVIAVGVFVDDVGSAAIVAPEQNGPTDAKVGVTGAVIVTCKVVVVAHCPAAGVNVYVVVCVLLIAGDQVPVTAVGVFVEVVGSVIAPPLQIGCTCVNVGVTGAFTVTVLVAVAPGQSVVVFVTV